MDKYAAISIIGFSAIISFFLAITVDMSNQGLGAMGNFIIPPFVGLMSLFLLLLVWWLIKTPNIRIVIAVLLSAYNIYVGLALHLEKENWPLVIF
jgi:hypothetical protein